jgi:hypothetical protein
VLGVIRPADETGYSSALKASLPHLHAGRPGDLSRSHGQRVIDNMGGGQKSNLPDGLPASPVLKI